MVFELEQGRHRIAMCSPDAPVRIGRRVDAVCGRHWSTGGEDARRPDQAGLAAMANSPGLIVSGRLIAAQKKLMVRWESRGAMRSAAKMAYIRNHASSSAARRLSSARRSIGERRKTAYRHVAQTF